MRFGPSTTSSPSARLSSPEALAFAEGEERVGFGRLRAEAEGLAGGLSGLGLGRGDRVALLLPAGLDFIRAFFALQRLGAVPCAFDPGDPPAAAVRRAERIRPRLLLVAGPAAEGLARARLGRRARAARRSPRCRREDRCAGRRRRLRCWRMRTRPSCNPRLEPPASRGPRSSPSATCSPRWRRPARRSGIGPARRPGELGAALARPRPAPLRPRARVLRRPLPPGEPAIRTLPLWLRTAARVRATILGAPDFAYRARRRGSSIPKGSISRRSATPPMAASRCGGARSWSSSSASACRERCGPAMASRRRPWA